MTLKDIIIRLNETDPRPNYTFERLVLRILEKFTTDQDKRFISTVSFSDVAGFTADAFVRDGLGDFSKNTIVEISYFKRPSIVLARMRLLRIAEKLCPYTVISPFFSLYLQILKKQILNE